ncbi:hypothetical protein IJJ97_06275 [bacterium]|nr:hypothetical protein [bacterium]
MLISLDELNKKGISLEEISSAIIWVDKTTLIIEKDIRNGLSIEEAFNKNKTKILKSLQMDTNNLGYLLNTKKILEKCLSLQKSK